MPVLVAALLAATAIPAFASDEPERPAVASVLAGWRIFNSQVVLKDDVGAGLRLGMGISPRVMLLTDFFIAPSNRKEGTGTATVHALRALARIDVLQGRARPYIVTGFGGLLFDFNDAQDYATGTFTTGYGVEYRLAGRARVTLEGDLDLYRNRTVVYSPTGQELSHTRRVTQGLGTVALGLGFAF